MLLGLVILAASFKAGSLPQMIKGCGKAGHPSYASLAKVPVLAYHGVADGQIEGKNYDLISKATLEEHFNYISKNFYPITIDELLAYYNTELDFGGKRPILLFFDDGLRSVYNFAFPLAKKYEIRFAVAFLPSEKEPYPKSGKMTLDQLREMRDSGLIEVVSHSFNHLNLTTLSDDEIREELSLSKEFLEKNIGPCHHLVVPYGSSNEAVRRLAKEAGYRSLFVHGRVVIEDESLFNPFVIKRIAISSEFGLSELAKLKLAPY